MELMLERVEKQVGPQTHLYPLDLTLVPRAVTVLLGATQAGKTSLMRVMAGLDAPTKGRVVADGTDVTGRPVRERNVSMVYQQFINYPSMTVADNIASPLKLRGEKGIAERVQALAARLHIEPFLERLPADLSGGQQQRVALARALAKAAPLLSVWGGKITTFRKLAEEAADTLAALLHPPRGAWTRGAFLPGGDLARWIGPPQRPDTDIQRFAQALALRHPDLSPGLVKRLSRAYGSRVEPLLAGGLGAEVAPGLHEAELAYLRRHEWARTAEDIVWRRSKLGLRLSAAEIAAIDAWIAANGAANARPLREAGGRL